VLGGFFFEKEGEKTSKTQEKNDRTKKLTASLNQNNRQPGRNGKSGLEERGASNIEKKLPLWKKPRKL